MTARFCIALFALGFAAVGCAPASESDDEDETWDEGPPDGDADGDAVSSSEALSTSVFQLPFPCGQVWEGQTRTNHSPVNSVDFNRADDLGDKVVAAAAGKVTRVDNEGDASYGRWIEIDHGGGYRTRYAHLQTQLVSMNQSVAKGELIGKVGSTGGSSGPHLHFELRRDGVAIRPVFNGAQALFFGSRSYTSHNACSGGGNGGGGNANDGFLATVDTAGPDLTVRAKATPNSAEIRSVADGASIRIKCQKVGASVSGTYGTTKLWDFIGDGYVSDAYVYTGSDGRVAPDCE